jgi:hypothetical protein
VVTRRPGRAEEQRPCSGIVVMRLHGERTPAEVRHGFRNRHCAQAESGSERGDTPDVVAPGIVVEPKEDVRTEQLRRRNHGPAAAVSGCDQESFRHTLWEFVLVHAKVDGGSPNRGSGGLVRDHEFAS